MAPGLADVYRKILNWQPAPSPTAKTLCLILAKMETTKILRFFIGLILLSLFACNTNSFDSKKWKEKGVDWWMTDYREKMVKDLIQSDTLIDKTRQQIILLLGEPDTKDSIHLEYLIREKFTNDIDPDYISYLKIQFDSTGKSVRCVVRR